MTNDNDQRKPLPIRVHHADGPAPTEPGAESGRGVPPALVPLVWLLAVPWTVIEAVGRGVGRFLIAYERWFTSAVRAAGRLVGAVVRALGPLGRLLRRWVDPLLRALRRGWHRLGRWVFIILVRPLGRLGRWLVTRTRPAVDQIIRWARTVAGWLEPVTRKLSALTLQVERAAAWLGTQLRRLWAPVARAAALRPRPGRSGRPPVTGSPQVRRIRADDALRLRDLRLAALADAPQAFIDTLAEAERQPPSHWAERAAGAEAGSSAATFVAIQDERWIATMTGLSLTDERARVVGVWVAPAHRGGGVGRQLLAAVADWARAGGHREVVLHVAEDNARARRFYELAGLSYTGGRRPHQRDPGRTDLEMAAGLTRAAQPPATAGMIETSVPSGVGVARPPANRTSSASSPRPT